MNADLDPLLGVGHPKVAGDQIELGVGRGELMLGAAVAKVQPGPASLIACLDVVNAVRHLCGVGQGAQPLAIGRRSTAS